MAIIHACNRPGSPAEQANGRSSCNCCASQRPSDLLSLSGDMWALLRSNVPPSDVQLQTMRAMIQDAERIMLHSHLKEDYLLPLVEGKEMDGINVMAGLEVIASPMRRVPLDVLQEIFLACVDGTAVTNKTTGQLEDTIHDDDPFTDTHPFSLDREYIPWALSWVSSRWRATAIGIPALWSNIIIHDKVIPVQSGNMTTWYPLTRTKLLKLQLHRSGTCLLSVSVAEDIDKYIPMLMGCSDRWGVLRLNKQRVKSLVAFGSAHAPKLHTVYIINSDTPPSSVFQACKSLHSIRATPADIVRWKYPKDQITECSILEESKRSRSNAALSGFQPSGHFTALPGLEKCTIFIHAPRYVERVHGPPFVHTRLRSLCLAAHALEGHGCHWLSYFTLPSLVSLEIEGDIDILIIVSFLKRSSCALTDLTLVSRFPRVRAMASLLQYIPSLLRLDLRGMSQFHTMLIRDLNLVDDSNNFVIVPRLESLSLSEGMGVVASDLAIILIRRPNLVIRAEGRRVEAAQTSG